MYGFPFILAVSGRTRAQILENFRQRVGRDPEVEFVRVVDSGETLLYHCYVKMSADLHFFIRQINENDH